MQKQILRIAVLYYWVLNRFIFRNILIRWILWVRPKRFRPQMLLFGCVWTTTEGFEIISFHLTAKCTLTAVLHCICDIFILQEVGWIGFCEVLNFRQKRSQTSDAWLCVVFGAGALIQHYLGASAEGTVGALKALERLISSFSWFFFFLFGKCLMFSM